MFIIISKYEIKFHFKAENVYHLVNIDIVDEQKHFKL